MKGIHLIFLLIMVFAYAGGNANKKPNNSKGAHRVFITQGGGGGGGRRPQPCAGKLLCKIYLKLK